MVLYHNGMTAKTEALLSADEYESLPEVDGYRDELIEGERVLTAFPMTPHVVVVKNLERLLEKQFPDRQIIRESGWYFRSAAGRENVPGPDLMVLSDEDYQHSVQAGRWFVGKPFFVVEVISPSERRYRRMQKVALYLEAGAGAVVEVVLTQRIVLVHRPEEEAAEVIRSGHIEWPFQADLGEIFARLP